MWVPPQSIRRTALEKLAVLSASTAGQHNGPSDLTKLEQLCLPSASPVNGAVRSTKGKASASRVPMGLRELQALLALCQAAPLVVDKQSAERLLYQLRHYLPEAHSQAINPSPFLRDLDPSPWEKLTFNITSAILSLGSSHPSLRTEVITVIIEYVEGWASSAQGLTAPQFDEASNEPYLDEDGVSMLMLVVSMLGFLKAAASHAGFWTLEERLDLIQSLRMSFSEPFMVGLETILSIVRNSRSNQRQVKEWKRYCKHYASIYRPLGAMLLQQGFMDLVKASVVISVSQVDGPERQNFLHALQSRRTQPQVDDFEESMVEGFVEIAEEEMKLLEDDSDFLRLGSAWQQRLAFDVKADTLTVYLCCSLMNSDIADPEILMMWLDGCLKDPVQVADNKLIAVVLRCLAILAKKSASVAAALSRSLPRFIVQNGLTHETAAVAGECLASILQLLPQDAIISTLYSLGNVLSAGVQGEKVPATSPFMDRSFKSNRVNGPYNHKSPGSAISLSLSDAEETTLVYETVVQTVAHIAVSCNDEKIIALAQSMLIQKLKRVNMQVDATIIKATALLGVHGGPNDFRSLVKLYAKISHEALAEDNQIILGAVIEARNSLSAMIKVGSPKFGIYLEHLLDEIVSKGDAQEGDGNAVDSYLAAREIGLLIRPLARLASVNGATTQRDFLTEDIVGLQRDAWFNVVVHGYTLTSERSQQFLNDLQILAQFSQPLIAEDRADQLESDVELNTVLRRGMSGPTTVAQKRALIEVFPTIEQDVRPLTYPEIVFLNAAHMVESLRARSGDCTKGLTYFLDPKLKSSAMGNCMAAVALGAVGTYLRKTATGALQGFSTPYLARQLAVIFTRCCHRVQKVQHVAIGCADDIITKLPSALCQQSSLFALLDVIDVMWLSCLQEETDEYEWTSRFTSHVEKISIELSDDFAFRKETLDRLYKLARDWMLKTINIAPLDVKGLLQTYLAVCDDTNAYGHVSMGRSLAMEMGSIIPTVDHRLVAIKQHTIMDVNTASGFVAQYTTRQEYRFARDLFDEEQKNGALGDSEEAPMLPQCAQRDTIEVEALLADTVKRVSSHKSIPDAELREVMRKGAALLCRSGKEHCSIINQLVSIPFGIFTKESMKLGVSLWIGLLKENPHLESRIMVEIFAHWEKTIRDKHGIFRDSFRHLDPFLIKQEFAPSNRETIKAWQHTAHGLIAPHLRIVQFLSSRFRASMLSNPQVQTIYSRFIHITLANMTSTASHPLCREVHFQIVLLGAKLLKYSAGLSSAAAWRLKDRILSTILAWFSGPPRWSFGGNRIQVKAETQLLEEIELNLLNLDRLGTKTTASYKPLQSKQDLTLLLIRSELSRLHVWLFPTNHERRSHFSSGHNRRPADAAVLASLKAAWAENPSIAVQLPTRFHSPRLAAEVRRMIINEPGKVLGSPDALEALVGSALSEDAAHQLKYLLYWSPVNPITAVTYFLPAYRSHPFIVQYAMRSLESHSVDITFFYVPQIVQTLRYDLLGYVARYIIETAKFSQLFAHQIIWNMKANAYKDEESKIPDPVKPKLDIVMEDLISSFSETDRAFYEREFSFFNEVTDVSGKLRPYIKRPKPEKKQKIEEELRKIHVEVGVYLPSNPEGVVVGIDRKSGKPLQSHAKAPYMATFRIRKESKGIEGIEEDLVPTKTNGSIKSDQGNTYEVWQSAIFKVGDDCRQDVLALQMIAAFRGIFHNVGLDVYVFPYRVTATAPGCGVIDVLPNTISRDMLGREAVNGLYDYFVSRYGGEDSVRFQEARSNFVKSMAAYSVISYLLQFKDRHNGNIMIDDAGHILHIDFGFCFDIAPGGIKFERAPFKLTGEMVAVMGGSIESQAFRWFEEMCIKAFLASRQHAEHLAHMVIVMLDSGLPCFKPETIQHFKDRFVLNRTDREAADFMKDLVRKSYSSYSTRGYDQFQLLTNGIPY